MSWAPIATIADDVNAGRVKAIDLVEQALAAIEEHKDYQAIISTLADAARSQAKSIDEKVANGVNAGRLAGVPFIAKDNLLVMGVEATAASNILKGFVPPYQSTVINRLEAEGAICVAKANQDAFGHGASTENSDFFVTKNPHDKTRVPGGSSGGSRTRRPNALRPSRACRARAASASGRSSETTGRRCPAAVQIPSWRSARRPISGSRRAASPARTPRML